MTKPVFEIIDRNQPKKQSMFSIRMEDEDIKKLHKLAGENNLNFHRFVKSILYGYIQYSEKGSS